MTQEVYTVITFAPVQGFIEKSRKLRDLYGSSYLLSFLSWVICNDAKSRGCEVVSPALPNITQGMPNQIIIERAYTREDAESALNKAWECVTESCRQWIEEEINDGWEYKFWKRNWGLWTKYAWEFFWVQGTQGESISDVRQRLNEEKRSRGWTGINWQGESSTLSGADGIAYPRLCEDQKEKVYDPKKYNYQAEKTAVKKFYKQLSERLGESFIDPNEELSIPELIKRLITHQVITEKLVQRLEQSLGANISNLDELVEQLQRISRELSPRSFKDLSRQNENDSTDKQTSQKKYWTCWFQGDGDKAGDYLKNYPEKTNEFSTMMRKWGEDFQNKSPLFCRVIYAGGDDFLGVFYDIKKEGRELKPIYCVNQFSTFKTQIWNQPEKKPITVSVGLVWAAPGIPQRDVLQHCREAEKSAKNKGRDRIAFRVLFNNGNYLEWVCPWWLLEQGLLSSYCDREEKQNWTHIYNDVAVLESRHAFNDQSTDVALGLLEIYFPTPIVDTIKDKNNWFHEDKADLTVVRAGILGEPKNYYKDDTAKIDDANVVRAGILGEPKNYYKDDTDNAKVNRVLNDWIINLAKVGFHLCQ